MGGKTKKLLQSIAIIPIVFCGIAAGYALAHPKEPSVTIDTPANDTPLEVTDSRQPGHQDASQASSVVDTSKSTSQDTVTSTEPQEYSTSTNIPSEKPSTVELEAKDGSISTYPNYEYHALYTPNDYQNQWHTDRINAPAVWSKTTGTAATTVAVIDTGFALHHDELFNRWATNQDEQQNGSDDDNNGYIDDWLGWDFFNNDDAPQAGTTHPNHQRVSHGTSVAGLIGAAGNNSLGIAGVNWHTQILPLQALSDTGVGYTSDITAAIDYAISRDVDVINLSLGGENHDPVLEAAIDRAISANILVVAAAGNDGCNCMSYPARYPQVLSVGASTQANTVATSSSYGETLDLVAPGSLIPQSTGWSASNQQSLYRNNISGTSYAAPIVSGAAALLKGVDNTLTVDELSRALTEHTSLPPALAASDRPLTYGAGILNLEASLHSIAPSLPVDPPLAYTPYYQATKAGRPNEYTASRDRIGILLTQGYQYEIARFITVQ